METKHQQGRFPDPRLLSHNCRRHIRIRLQQRTFATKFLPRSVPCNIGDLPSIFIPDSKLRSPNTEKRYHQTAKTPYQSFTDPERAQLSPSTNSSLTSPLTPPPIQLHHSKRKGQKPYSSHTANLLQSRNSPVASNSSDRFR